MKSFYNSKENENESKILLPEEMINLIISYNMKPTETSLLIRDRFGPNYDGIRTIYEINDLKEEMDNAEREYNKTVSKYRPYLIECYDKLSAQEKLCTAECKQRLQEHLNICADCNMEYVGYDCEYKDDNGRCSHYIIMRSQEEDIDHYEYINRKYLSIYNVAKDKYTREVAKKDGTFDEYIEEMERLYEQEAREALMYY